MEACKVKCQLEKYINIEIIINIIQRRNHFLCSDDIKFLDVRRYEFSYKGSNCQKFNSPIDYEKLCKLASKALNITYEGYRDIPSTVSGCLYQEVNTKKTAVYNINKKQTSVPNEYGLICTVAPGNQCIKHFGENESIFIMYTYQRHIINDDIFIVLYSWRVRS